MVLIDKAKLLNTIAKEVHYDSEHSLEMYAKMLSLINDAPDGVVRCKECKYFHYNKAYNIQGFPIMGNSVCDKWANGCRTDENGYCFLGERREDETD